MQPEDIIMSSTLRHLVGSLLLLRSTSFQHLPASSYVRLSQFSTARSLLSSGPASLNSGNRNMKFIYAFDFDGVLVDSAAELGLSGYDAAKLMFPGEAWLSRRLRRPDQLQNLVDGFREVRPCLETGWEAPLLIKLLTDESLTREHIVSNFHRGLREKVMEELKVSTDQCKDALKQARNRWIESDETAQDWLDAHSFYEGACDAVRNLLEDPVKCEDVYIITTKAADYTARLLEKKRLFGPQAPNGGIPEDKIFGLGSPPKPVVLANLLKERGDEYGAVFVEDRLLTLDDAMADPNINRKVVPVVASWGYNTPEQREGGKKAGYKVLSNDDPSSLGDVLNDEAAGKYLAELNSK